MYCLAFTAALYLSASTLIASEELSPSSSGTGLIEDKQAKLLVIRGNTLDPDLIRRVTNTVWFESLSLFGRSEKDLTIELLRSLRSHANLKSLTFACWGTVGADIAGILPELERLEELRFLESRLAEPRGSLFARCSGLRRIEIVGDSGVDQIFLLELLAAPRIETVILREVGVPSDWKSLIQDLHGEHLKEVRVYKAGRWESWKSP